MVAVFTPSSSAAPLLWLLLAAAASLTANTSVEGGKNKLLLFVADLLFAWGLWPLCGTMLLGVYAWCNLTSVSFGLMEPGRVPVLILLALSPPPSVSLSLPLWLCPRDSKITPSLDAWQAGAIRTTFLFLFVNIWITTHDWCWATHTAACFSASLIWDVSNVPDPDPPPEISLCRTSAMSETPLPPLQWAASYAQMSLEWCCKRMRVRRSVTDSIPPSEIDGSQIGTPAADNQKDCVRRGLLFDSTYVFAVPWRRNTWSVR